MARIQDDPARLAAAGYDASLLGCDNYDPRWLAAVRANRAARAAHPPAPAPPRRGLPIQPIPEGYTVEQARRDARHGCCDPPRP